jgi:hypothetical protein
MATKLTVGTLEQDLWMASPSQATTKTELKTVKVLGIPITVAGVTKWSVGTDSKPISPTTAVGMALTAMLIISAIVLALAVLAGL